MKKNNDAGITIGGIALIIGVSVATIFSSILVVNKMNDNADADYLSTLQTIQAGVTRSENDNADIADKAIDITDDEIIVDADDSKKYIVVIDGESYISSEYVDSAKSLDIDDDNANTLALDKDNVITIDGVDYIHIDTENSVVREEFTPQNGYIGLNYVDIDVDGNVVYHINRGDTLSEISGKVGYSVDSIANENDINNPNLIYEGSSIRIPVNDTIKNNIKDNKSSDEESSTESKDDVDKTTEE